MRAWKRKVLIPGHGVCTVKTATDKEAASVRYAPISHGFVNLFHGDKYIAFCGVNYAKARIIKS